jgi:hypothetical protein
MHRTQFEKKEKEKLAAKSLRNSVSLFFHLCEEKDYYLSSHTNLRGFSQTTQRANRGACRDPLISRLFQKLRKTNLDRHFVWSSQNPQS